MNRRSRSEGWFEHWTGKFATAGKGLLWAVRGQTSFAVHAPVALAVIAIAIALRLEPWRVAGLILAVTVVMSAELLNTAIEQLVKVLHPELDERVGQALDAAAAAVLVAAIGAVAIGVIILGPPLWQLLVALAR